MTMMDFQTSAIPAFIVRSMKDNGSNLDEICILKRLYLVLPVSQRIHKTITGFSYD
jgi:hypothetical protein